MVRYTQKNSGKLGSGTLNRKLLHFLDFSFFWKIGVANFCYSNFLFIFACETHLNLINMASIKIPRNVTKSEAREYLLSNYPITQLVEELVDYIQQEECDKVSITMQQFEKFFRVKGIANLDLATHTMILEKRGRKPLSPLAQRRAIESRGRNPEQPNE